MKKLIVDFGIENISVIKVDVRGKETKVQKAEFMDAAKYLNDSGTYDIKRVAEDIKRVMGKDATTLDMEIVLPDYLTKTQYKETATLEGVKPSEIREPNNSKMYDKQICLIGDNGNENITQVIFMNKQVIKNFINELYKAKLNVVSAICKTSAYQNTMPLFVNSEEYSNMSENFHLLVVTGVNSIDLVIMKGNLPLDIQETEYSLFSMFQHLKDMGNLKRFSEFLTKYNDHSVTQVESIVDMRARLKRETELTEADMYGIVQDAFDDSMYQDQEEVSEEPVVNKDEQKKQNRYVASEVNAMIKGLSTKIFDVMNFIKDEYGSSTVDICCSDRVMAYRLQENLGGVFTVNNKYELSKEINIGDYTINLSEIEAADVRLLGCLGNTVCNMKKGDDFYV